MRALKTLTPVAGVALAAMLAVPDARADEGFSVGGYVHYDVHDFQERPFDSTRDASDVRRVRPVFQYKSPAWSARFMPDLERETNLALDAYVDITPDAPWDLRIGRFKSPLSMNSLQSSNALVVMENSVVAAMTPNRDNGVLLGFDTGGESSWRLEAGVFDGAADDAVKGSLDGGAEWTLHALRTQRLGNGRLRLGVGASGGQREGAPGDARLARGRTPGLETWFRYASDAYSDGTTGRTVVSADWQQGPWYVQAEAIRSTETVRLANRRARVARRGWELQASRVLTGEDRGIDGVKPANLRLPGLDLPVAVEVGARVAGVRVDEDAFEQGLADPEASGDRLRSAGVSLALWFPKQWRVQVDYEHSRIGYRAGAEATERVLLARAILAF
ncbi:MAG TPA: porin [Luteimonas sp.]|nr:porin [Luteimonas sp.]